MKYEQKLFIIIVRDNLFVLKEWIIWTKSLGENPQFNEAFEFEIAFPELALVRFVVLDDE